MAGAHKARFVARARTLRGNQTDAETRLWSRLRNRQVFGFKFVRQHPVGPYVADFACREGDLIVEVDGGQHAESRTDERRTAVLSEHGYRVIRFWNNEVLGNTDGVLQVIADALRKAPSPGLRYAKSDLSPGGEVAGGRARATTPNLPVGGEVAGGQDRASASTSPLGERSAEGRVRGPLP